jgi:hypothetical protein
MKALAIMNISKDEIQTYGVKKLDIDPLKGSRNEAQVNKFNEKLKEKWKVNGVDKLLRGAKANGNGELLDSAMAAVTMSFVGASNWINRHYKTGKVRKTYYSIENMNVGYYLKTVGKLRTYWNRRVESGKPFDHSPCRGQSRNGKHAGGEPVQLVEHKKRLVALAKSVFNHDFGTSKEGKMRFCYGTSSDKSLKKIQQKYKDHLKKLAHLPSSLFCFSEVRTAFQFLSRLSTHALQSHRRLR